MSDGLILCDIMSNLVKEFSESLFTDTGKDIDSKGQFYLNKFLSDRYYEKLFEYETVTLSCIPLPSLVVISTTP